MAAKAERSAAVRSLTLVYPSLPAVDVLACGTGPQVQQQSDGRRRAEADERQTVGAERRLRRDPRRGAQRRPKGTGRSTGGWGEVFVIAAIGPEAQADKRGFGRAVATAQARLELIEED